MAKNETGSYEKSDPAELYRLCELSGVHLFAGAGRLYVSTDAGCRFTCAQLRPYLKLHARELLPLLPPPPCARCVNLRLVADSDGRPKWVCALNLTASRRLNDLASMRATPDCAARRGYAVLKKSEAACEE